MSIETTDRIYKFVSGLLNRKLTYEEKTGLISFINREHTRGNMGTQDAQASVIYIADMAKKYYELLVNKSVCDINSVFGYTNIRQPNRAYLCLDSRYATFNNERTKLSWCISETMNNTDNISSLIGGVRNINWIRMQSVVVHKFSSTPQRATILIEELASQSFLMPSGRKFHFVGLLNDIQNPISVGDRNASVEATTPDITMFDTYELLSGYKFNEGFYRFNQPISMLNNITVSVGNPDSLVVIPKYEYVNGTVVSMYSDSITIELGEAHNLITQNGTGYVLGTWYSVFVDGLNTNEATNRIYENYVNRREHTCITLPTATRITITFRDYPAGYYGVLPSIHYQPLNDVPLSQVSTVRVRINCYRVIINLEMEYDG